MPRVSVITPTYNCSKFIVRALDSVLAQTYADYEVIVVDDGSTDGTGELLERWKGRIKYIHQENRGLPAARNVAVSNSTGEFLAYLDADDMWYPWKLERQVSFMDAHPECAIVHGELTLIDEEDSEVHPEWAQNRKAWLAQGACLMEMLGGCLIQVPTVMERRAAFDAVGGFDERFRRVEDYLHWLQVLLLGYEFGYIEEPLARYRLREGSLTGNRAAMAEATKEMFRVLAEENGLFEKQGAARAVVQRRITLLDRSLPYHYRQLGRNDIARRKAVRLVRKSPANFHSYVEVFKSCLPASFAEALRGFRTMIP